MMKLKTTRRLFLRHVASMLASQQLARKFAHAGTRTDAPSGRHHHMLWFDKPASQWADALPVGNGRLGAMVFGGFDMERIALNEDTLWSGAPGAWNNPDAPGHLAEVRRLVLTDMDYVAADREARKMQGPYNAAYQPLGDLNIKLEHGGTIGNYRRELDLDQAMCRVSYEAGGARYLREVFVSYPAQLVVIRLEVTGRAGLSAEIGLSSAIRSTTVAIDDNTLVLKGKAPNYSAPNYVESKNPVQYSERVGEGMHFAAVLHASAIGGKVKSRPDGRVSLEGVQSAVLLVSMGTGYKGFALAPDTPLEQVVETARARLAPTATRGYESIFAEHLADHRKLYRRTDLDLASSIDGSALPTDQRVSSFQAKPDPALLALYFNFGRYLLITSSRPGTQPANLQGIWNGELRPPWSSNWTANINVQMNYWPVETCNLSECHLPLLHMVTDLSRNGAETARVNYDAKGWVSHHNVDLWRQSAPVGMGAGTPTWANFAMSGPWLCAHFYEHYLFTGDKKFLLESYPVLKGSAEFCLDWLVERADGQLTTCPSVSTENTFLTPEGKRASVSDGCTMDIALIRELFSNVMQASKVLDIDHEFAATLSSALKRLPAYQIGRFGQLQEWSSDFKEDEPGQRHMSHLYPVYPGAEITPRNNPTFAAAARASLERRIANGGAYTGWSRAWAIGLWARLGDGEKAWESLQMLMQHSTGRDLFDTHPATPSDIFQIDGNFGTTAAIAELLLQSHDGEVAFLPALPKAWDAGTVRGLRARGGLEISMKWLGGRIHEVDLIALADGKHCLRPPVGQTFKAVTSIGGSAPALRTGERPGTMSLNVQSGRHYKLLLT